MAEVTLKDVIDRLKAEGQLLRNTGTNSIKSINTNLENLKPIFSSIENSVINMSNAITTMITNNQEMIEEQKRANQLASVGGGPENNGSGRSDDLPEVNKKMKKEKLESGDGIFSKIFAGSFLGNMFSGILSPLKSLATIVGRNGPLGIAVTLLYTVFRDIGENETFKNTLETIKITWNDKIVPSFLRIKDSVTQLMESDGASKIIDIFNNIRIQIQNFVSNTLQNVFDTIGSTLEGIAMVLEGDWINGISTIVSSLFTGVANLFDDALTSLLTMLGINFSKDGSLFKSITNFLKEWGIDVKEMWNGFKSGLKDAFKVVSDLFAFGESDYAFFGTLGKLTDIAFAGVNVAINFIRGIFGFATEGEEPFKMQDYIGEKISDAIGWAKEIFSGMGEVVKDKFAQLSNYVSSLPDRIRIAAEKMFVDVSERVQVGFLEFGDWIGSIPARIKLLALSAIRDATSYLPEWAQIVSDADVSGARDSVDNRSAELQDSISAVRESANQSRALLEERSNALDKMETAALQSYSPTVIVNAPTTVGPRVTNVQGGTNVTTNTVFGGSSGMSLAVPGN